MWGAHYKIENTWKVVIKVISSDRWDWWNEGKDPADKPKSWQPLTEEERARVVVVPRKRRLGFDPDRPMRTRWRQYPLGQDSEACSKQLATEEPETEQPDMKQEQAEMTLLETKRPETESPAVEITMEVEITDISTVMPDAPTTTTTQRSDYSMAATKLYSAETLVKAIIAMADYYGRLPTTAQIASYAEEHPGTPSYQTILKQLGPKSTWEDKISEYQAAKSQPATDTEGVADGDMESIQDTPESTPPSISSPTPPQAAAPAATVLPEAAEPTATDCAVQPHAPEVPQITLSGVAKFTVKVGDQEYRFRLAFDDLTPAAE